MRFFLVSEHGKADRRQLLKLFHSCQEKSRQHSTWESILESQWKHATGDIINDSANFISSGGDSLSAVKLVYSIQDSVGSAHPLPELLDILLNRTFSGVSKYVREELLKQPAASEMLNDKVRDIVHHSLNSSEIISIQAIDKCADVNESIHLEWKFDMKKCVDSSPLLVESDGMCIAYIGSHAHRFSAIDVVGGREIWTIELGIALRRNVQLK